MKTMPQPIRDFEGVKALCIAEGYGGLFSTTVFRVAHWRSLSGA
jgi:hypothetical protein